MRLDRRFFLRVVPIYLGILNIKPALLEFSCSVYDFQYYAVSGDPLVERLFDQDKARVMKRVIHWFRRDLRISDNTGYMHNRARMIVAMFLTKDLHIHWREGEKYFMQKLVDGDIPANNGGWQWSACTGADAVPYFRIQNPWTQTANCDPLGQYIKRWVPELKDVDPVRFTAPPAEKLASGYPLPMVDHGKERKITIERFRTGAS